MTPKRGGRGGSKRGVRGRAGRPPLKAKSLACRYDEDSTSTSNSSSSTSEHLSPTQSSPIIRSPPVTPSASIGSSPDIMKMTMCTAPTMVPRPSIAAADAAAAHHHQHLNHPTSPGKTASRLGAGRRPGKRVPIARHYAGKIRSMITRRSVEEIDYPTNDSSDSGLSFDQHTDSHVHNLAINDRLAWPEDRIEAKRRMIAVKVEHDEVNENYTFPERNTLSSYGNNMLIRTAPSSSVVPTLSNVNSNGTSSPRAVPRCLPLANRNNISLPITLTTQLSHTSRYMDVTLSILCQPEQQHRARYQTEGSRGAVKDRSGNGFPVVKLTGYHKPTTLQVFIGTDLGKVAPHMFYQSCRVSGKNSTPCTEKKMDGTIVIELQLEPGKDMIATCDCVGILKERNVDVEHRFPDQLANRSKKKSTRCRMVFRTYITHDDGLQETLQVCSQPIVCTQPPGIPEISKKSLTSCPANGGLELFILGKNFLKDTLVYFHLEDEDRHIRWEQSVAPDKEFLQQTHLVCVVPPFMNADTIEACTVRLYVVSSGKCSESHQFVYTPVVVNGSMASVRPVVPFMQKMLWPGHTTASATSPTTAQEDHDIGMMPPPETNMVPLSTQRRPSISSTSQTTCSCPEVHSPPIHRCINSNSSSLKLELMDESSQNSVMDCPEQRFRRLSDSSMDIHQTDSSMSMVNENSMDMLRHGVSMGMNDNSNHSLMNDNSMVRQNSFSRLSYCDNSMTNSSMDIHNANSNLSPSQHDDNSCQSNTPIYAQMHSDLSNASVEELKVIDLRTQKLPMATVADLVSTSAPSMATLQSFGVTESTNMPLQAQTVQSIENYLTNLDKVIVNENDKQLITQNGFLTRLQSLELSQMLNNVVKSESASIAQATTVDRAILPSVINTERLDALVNCAVDTHMQQPKTLLMDSKSMTPRDVILNAPVMVPLMNSVALVTVQQNGNCVTELNSPSIMCRANVDMNAMCQVTPPIPLNTPLSLAVSGPENAIILNAAVDLLETQKQLNELQTKQAQFEGLLTTAVGGVSGDTFTPFSNAPIAAKSMDLMPVLTTDQSQSTAEQDKKNEDRMIPQAFPSLSENELINIINPSCFDQGNNYH